MPRRICDIYDFFVPHINVLTYLLTYFICLERGADLLMAQLMPLPPTVSCFSKIQIGFTFLVLVRVYVICMCVHCVLNETIWYCRLST